MNKVTENISVDNFGTNRLQYLAKDEVMLDFPFILCHEKRLRIGYPYLKKENCLAGSHIQAVRLLKVWDEDNVVYLKIQDLVTSKVDTLSYNLKYIGGFWLWSLASLDYILSITGKKNNNILNDEELLEFDF
jgi:hypothetical protein